MKKFILLSLVVAFFGGGFVQTASAQQMRFGTVDMKKVFESYYKTKEAEQRINEARNQAKKELEDREEERKKLGNEANKIIADLQRPELSKESKAGKEKERDDKIAEFRAKEQDMKDFQTTREKQLQEQSVRMRGAIVDEINKVISDRVKSENFDFVFDRSGPSLNGVPVVLHAGDKFDFTNDVVTALNKNRLSDKSTDAVTPPVAEPVKAATPVKKPAAR